MKNMKKVENAIVIFLILFIAILNLINKIDIFNIITIVLLSLVLILIIFILNKQKETYKKFFIIALFFGITLIFANPILHGIDERPHFYKVYSVFYGINEDYDEDNNLCYNIPKIIEDTKNIKTYDNLKYFLNKKIDNKMTVLSDEYLGITLYSGMTYITYILPMFIFQFLLKLPISLVVYSGRFFSFIFWLLISMYTIKIIPKRKEFMAFLCLMPINLTIVTSYTGDLLTNSTILLFIAYWYKLYEEKRLIKKSELLLIVILGIFTSYCKIVYSLIFLIFLFLPKECFGNIKNKNYISAIVLLIILFAAIFNLSFVGKDLYYAYPEIEQQKNWIMNNFLSYILILLKTILLNLQIFLCEFTTGDTTMLQNTVVISSVISEIYFVLLVASLFMDEVDLKLNKFAKVLISIITILIINVIFVSLYVQWTARNYGIAYSEIEGVQGRYFLPVFALLALSTNKKLDLKIINNILWDGALLINFYVLLNIITIF